MNAQKIELKTDNNVMMMKAMAISGNGEVSPVEVPRPTLSTTAAAGDNRQGLLVRVKYAAIDTAVDAVLNHYYFGTGYFLHARTDPLVLGWHFSGVVVEAAGDVAVGEGMRQYKEGDEVFGHLPYDPNNRQGSFSEVVAVPADEVALKPPGVGHDVAAASTTECLTALQALRDHAGLGRDDDPANAEKKRNGSSVLIVGAGGGVGSAAVAIAKRLDPAAQVTALCSGKDADRVKALGADSVLDRGQVNFLEEDSTYDVTYTPELEPGGRRVPQLV
jgi:NADPH:quinone reductase-like Zn-dependent oxidoreductase